MRLTFLCICSTIILEHKFDNMESDRRLRSMDDFLKGFLKENEVSDDPSTKWIKWKHISQGKTQCKDCLELDGCWFAKTGVPKLRCIRIAIV